MYICTVEEYVAHSKLNINVFIIKAKTIEVGVFNMSLDVGPVL